MKNPVRHGVFRLVAVAAITLSLRCLVFGLSLSIAFQRLTFVNLIVGKVTFGVAPDVPSFAVRMQFFAFAGWCMVVHADLIP